MTLLHPHPTVAVNRFTWNKATREFTAEASDLGLRAGFTFGQIWDDSCDEGLTLASRYPGQSDAVCVVDRTETSEGDILAWHLKPVQCGLNFTVTIYND
jgi:hypothetical protein